MRKATTPKILYCNTSTQSYNEGGEITSIYVYSDMSMGNKIYPLCYLFFIDIMKD